MHAHANTRDTRSLFVHCLSIYIYNLLVSTFTLKCTRLNQLNLIKIQQHTLKKKKKIRRKASIRKMLMQLKLKSNTMCEAEKKA